MRNRLTKEVNENLQRVCRHQPSPIDPDLNFRQCVAVHEPEVVETWATFDRVSVLHRWSLSRTSSALKKEAAVVWSLSSLFLSLSLPQIKISVIKLIKVMHANMPYGSRPDFIRHTVVESCRSSTFDVAFFIIENNWIPPSPPLSLWHTHTYILPMFTLGMLS